MPALAAALALSCTSPQTSDGPVYRSERGFTITLSPQWLVVHRLDIDGKENPIGTGNQRIRSLFTADVLNGLKEKALANGVELFVNLETSDEALIESINVQAARGNIAIEESEMTPACAETEKRLTALYGQPVKMSACKALKIRRLPSICLEYGVEKPALAHAQYLIQLKPDHYIVMTLTCRPANLPRLRQELDAIVSSFRQA
ncbi:MAG: hypothetical protein ACM34C_00430 [Syntrophaceae bacterium]